MQNRNKTIFAVIVTILVLAFFPLDLTAQERAPEFSLTDLQGKTFRLKDYRAKTVLLIFGTTWCPSCRSEIPHFKQIFAKYSPRGLEVAYVNILESRDKAARFSAKYQLPYRTLLDQSGQVANTYDVVGVPAMILIRDGKILTRNYRLIDSYLEKLFSRSSR